MSDDKGCVFVEWVSINLIKLREMFIRAVAKGAEIIFQDFQRLILSWKNCNVRMKFELITLFFRGIHSYLCANEISPSYLLFN